MINRLRVNKRDGNKFYASNAKLNSHGLPMPLETERRLLFR